MMLVQKHKSALFSTDLLSIKNLNLASPSLIMSIPENLKDVAHETTEVRVEMIYVYLSNFYNWAITNLFTLIQS